MGGKSITNNNNDDDDDKKKLCKNYNKFVWKLFCKKKEM